MRICVMGMSCPVMSCHVMSCDDVICCDVPTPLSQMLAKGYTLSCVFAFFDMVRAWEHDMAHVHGRVHVCPYVCVPVYLCECVYVCVMV